MPELIKPKKLKAGDTIGMMATSSYCLPADSEDAKTELEKLGYKVFVHPQCHAREYMSAGTVKEKLAALHELIADPGIDAIFCVRGGYRAIHMLDGIDYSLIRNNPKIITGFSDVTALHAVILKKAGVVTFHAPSARSYGQLADKTKITEHDSCLSTLDFLQGNIPENLFHEQPVKIIKPGDATGKIWGGNVQLLSALNEAGSKYHPAFDGAILVIEDISEEITKLDRQLGAWRLRGIFKNLAGLVVGQMTDIKDTPGRVGPFVHDVEYLIREHAHEVQGPIVMNAPFGHEHPNYTFPFGINARLTAPENGKPQLQLLESPFSD
jgi:muramoyltetrapeptide carboxypeptidase